MREQQGDVIEFDNLYRSTDIIGEYEGIKAKTPEPFSSSNAPGMPRSFDSREAIAETAKADGRRFREAFAS